MPRTLSYYGTLVDIGPCWNCGLHYAVPEDFKRKNREEGRSWWCPGCGKSTVYRQSDVEEQRERAERAERAAAQARAEAEAARRSGSALRGHLTRVKKRVAAGKCPCCSQHFEDLEAHMNDRHPGYENPAGEEES